MRWYGVVTMCHGRLSTYLLGGEGGGGRGRESLDHRRRGGVIRSYDKSWEYLILTKTGLMMVSPRSPPVYLRIPAMSCVSFNLSKYFQ